MIIANIAMKEANLSIKSHCESISEFGGETCHKARGKDYPPDCNMRVLRPLNTAYCEGVFLESWDSIYILLCYNLAKF